MAWRDLSAGMLLITLLLEEMVNPNYRKVQANASQARSALDRLSGGSSSTTSEAGCVVH